MYSRILPLIKSKNSDDILIGFELLSALSLPSIQQFLRVYQHFTLNGHVKIERYFDPPIVNVINSRYSLVIYLWWLYLKDNEL